MNDQEARELWSALEQRLRNHPPGMNDEEVTKLVFDLSTRRVQGEIWDLRDKIAHDQKATPLSKEMREAAREVRILIVREARPNGEAGKAMRDEFISVEQAAVFVRNGARLRGRLQHLQAQDRAKQLAEFDAEIQQCNADVARYEAESQPDKAATAANQRNALRRLREELLAAKTTE